MNINQGEIWLVDFENNQNNDLTKLTPVVVINDDRVGKFGIKIVVPIREWKDRYKSYPWIIKLTTNNENMLEKDSSIDCFQVKNCSSNSFHNKIGVINKNLMKEVHRTIVKTLNPVYKID